jgi:hypothetical protein
VQVFRPRRPEFAERVHVARGPFPFVHRGFASFVFFGEPRSRLSLSSRVAALSSPRSFLSSFASSPPPAPSSRARLLRSAFVLSAPSSTAVPSALWCGLCYCAAVHSSRRGAAGTPVPCPGVGARGFAPRFPSGVAVAAVRVCGCRRRSSPLHPPSAAAAFPSAPASRRWSALLGRPLLSVLAANLDFQRSSGCASASSTSLLCCGYCIVNSRSRIQGL